MTKDEYATYLLTPGWRERRTAAVSRANGRCQLCNGSRHLQVHHRTYERVGRELAGDLTVLCRDCHERFHGVGAHKPAVKLEPQRKKPRKKQPRPVRITAMQLHCPKCPAQAHRPCVSLAGKVVKLHQERRKQAKRAVMEVRLEEGTLRAEMAAMKVRNTAKYGA